MNTHQLISIFCEIDDFCKTLNRCEGIQVLTDFDRGRRGPTCCLTMSEIMTILVQFQMSGYKTFKVFYCGFLQCYGRRDFPNLPSYSRFVELIQYASLPLALFTYLKSGQRTGIYYIDSTCLPVCSLQRIKRHRVFRDIAQLGRTSIGWFFGLKLHLVINHTGQLIAFKITPGNTADRTVAFPLLKPLNGLAFGDKGYIGKQLLNQLFQRGLKLITRKRKNMQPISLTSYESSLLRQRTRIETVFDHLKHQVQVWHTRHRSVFNAISHLLSALAAYALKPLSLPITTNPLTSN